MLSHPWVIGGLTLSQLSRRSEIIGLLQNVPNAPTATDAEVLTLIENQHLLGLGIGYGDPQVLAATLLSAGAALWTRGKRLAAVAARLGLAESPVPKT